jgi:hypothetical protein
VVFLGEALSSAFPAGSTDVQSLTVADFDGDGRPDIVAGIADGVSILRSLPDGTLAAAQSLRSADLRSLRGQTTAAADFDGDGAMDLAYANISENSVTILLGAGDSTLRIGGHYPAGFRPNQLTAADFNGDGHYDIAVSSEEWTRPRKTGRAAGRWNWRIVFTAERGWLWW